MSGGICGISVVGGTLTFSAWTCCGEAPSSDICPVVPSTVCPLGGGCNWDIGVNKDLMSYVMILR